MRTKIEVPTNLSGFTLKQYQRYSRIEEPTDEDLLECFLDLDKDFIYNIAETSFQTLTAKITGLITAKIPLVHRFKHNGVEYGFEPDLDGCTYGVNRDASTYLGDVQTYHKALEVLYRPVVDKHKGRYTIEPYKGTTEVSESFKDVSLDIVLGMTVFFYDLTNDLLSSIPKFLLRQVQEELQQRQDLEKNGEHIKKFLHLLTEMLD